jgi:hypothetical protein
MLHSVPLLPAQIKTKKTCNNIANVYLCRYVSFKLNWDAVGAVASIACAIHCAVFPLLIGAMPFLNFFDNIFFEWGMISVAAVVGTYALIHGLSKHHKQWRFVAFFAVGIAILITKQFFAKPTEIYFLIAGVPLILWAHYGNYKLCHASKCSSPHHKH